MKKKVITISVIGLSVLALGFGVAAIGRGQCCGTRAAAPEAAASPTPRAEADHAARLAVGLKHIDAAMEAVKAGHTKDALASLAKARAAVAETHKALTHHAHKAGFANVKCPIMGRKIDPKNVPASLTREFRGEKVGFCCAGCPAAWDKLSDAQKLAKLQAVRPARPKPTPTPAIVNVRCPIMGSKVDPKSIPANLTRVFKGQKVGFCCPGCPAAWDKLSDAEKAAKLQAALSKGPGK